MFGQNSDFVILGAGGIYNYHSAVQV